MINIVSYNVNGLRDFKKRKKLFYHLKQIHQADLVPMQETHCTLEVEMLWQNQWGGKMINSFGESNARGVALLIGKEVQCDVERFEVDSQGRFVIAEIKIDEQLIVLVGVYAPNVDRPQFFQQLLCQVDDFSNPNIILAGDFTLLFDTNLDRAGTSEYNHIRSKQLVVAYMEETELCDIWRIRNPDTRRYTCHKKNSPYFSRIDYFLVSHGLVHCVNSCSICVGFGSDHSIVKLSCQFAQYPRGQGFWKFNTRLLRDYEQNCIIRSTIEAAAFRYENENPALRWEMIKMEIADASARYAKSKVADRNKQLRDLNECVEWLTILLEISPQGEQKQIEKMLQDKKTKYQELMDIKLRGLVFRSKWYEQGERSSKYYFNLEKSRYNKKTVKQVYDADGILQTNPWVILDVQAKFFTELYKQDVNVKFNLQNKSERAISEEQASKLEMPELTLALNSLNDQKTPGTDGIPCEFYKQFWEQLGPLLLSTLQYAKDQDILHISARRGIISLIPKKDKDNRYVENS